MPDVTPQGIAVVTGASSGIGAVYADRLARRGHDLILVARRADRLQTLAVRLAADHGRRVEPLAADLATEAGLRTVEQALKGRAEVTMLVNNAGLARMSPLARAPLADSLAQIALNVTAPVRLAQAVLPGFKARGTGTIVNIASILGIHSLPSSAVYSGSKAFMLAFSRGLQAEVRDSGVRVQAVLPAATATEIWDQSGTPLASFDAGVVMTAEAMVDAALAGLDQGEAVTWPSLADAALWERFEAARSALFAATQTGTPAPRYTAS